LSLLLVIASGLFVTTLSKLHSVSLGFNKANVLLFNLNAQIAGYDETRAPAFYESLRKRFAAIPGVRAATMTHMPMASGWSSSNRFTMPGISKQQGRTLSTNVMLVGPTFFETMQIPILLGRAIDEHDSAASPRFVVVNEVFAKKFLSGRNPIGQHFAFKRGQSLDCQIVGVSKSARYSSLIGNIPPVVYVSWAQPPTGWLLGGMYFELRTFGNPLLLVNTVRQIVHREDPHVPLSDIGTQMRYIDANIVPERIFANLCTCFGALGLLIACVGLYGTMAYTVARRTNEIGVRMALGAQGGRVVWLVLAEVLALTSAGVAIGIAIAWQATRLIASFLFGVRPHDVFVLAASAAALAICSFIAGGVPAIRAAGIDPMEALRHE
jgi:predicted permease